MSLADLQRVLALASTGADSALTPPERRLLVEIPAGQLALFAGGLVVKRREAVRALLPRTAARLGERFEAQFAAFASDSVPRGPARHQFDALAFAAFLHTGGEEAASIASWEAARVRAGMRGPFLLIRVLRAAEGPRLGVWIRFWRRGGLVHLRIGRPG